MRDIAFSRTSYRRFGSNTRLATNCCPRRMEGKFQNALTADLRRVGVDGGKRYENGSMDADQLMRFR